MRLNVVAALLLLVLPLPAAAVKGTADFNTWMFKSYEDNWREKFAAQFVTMDDWYDEMSDIASSYYFVKGPRGFATMSGGLLFNADVVAFSSHGSQEGSLSSTKGRVVAWEKDQRLILNDVVPWDDEMEILFIFACDFMVRRSYDTWFVLRNIHSKGSLVTTGCWGKCWIYDDAWNSTWNEVGDEFANGSTAKTAWAEAYEGNNRNDDIAVFGLGSTSAGNCDDRARKVKWSNRLNYTKYNYAVDLAAYSGYEVCGYYWDDL